MSATDKQPIYVMVDIETLGTKPGAKILSIGACVVNNTSRTDELFLSSFEPEFYERYGQLQPGLTIDEATVAWWDKQDPVARDEAFSGTEYLGNGLLKFAFWLRELEKYGTIHVVGNAARFDMGLLEAAYSTLCNTPVPWNHRNEICYRTLKTMFPEVKVVEFNGTKHNALHDARFQAAHMEAILMYIERIRTPDIAQ